MESWAFLGFRTHWQHVYSAISRERRTALRCKEWCFDVSTSFFSKQSILLDKRHHSFAVPSQNVSEIPEASAFDDFATCVHLLSWLKISASMISRTPEDLHGFSIALVRWRPTVTLAFRVAKCAQRVKLSRAFMHVRPISPWTSLRKWLWRCQPCWKNGDINHPTAIIAVLFSTIWASRTDFQDGKLKDGFKKQMVPWPDLHPITLTEVTKCLWKGYRKPISYHFLVSLVVFLRCSPKRSLQTFRSCTMRGSVYAYDYKKIRWIMENFNRIHNDLYWFPCIW